MLSRSGSSPHTWGIPTTYTKCTKSKDGSSPHTWGIQRLQISTGQLLRFIPTYVGHTRAGSPPILRRTVHPHIRGAYSGSGKSRSLKNGSSPHTWGIHRRYQPFRAGSRFIPTYVGHTSTVAARVASSTGSSPHTWGIRRFLVGVQDADGSSPHTWGIPCEGILFNSPSRFIPTYVGHTRAAQIPGPAGSVHPHIRGAYWYTSASFSASTGSSPHTWGIRLQRRSSGTSKTVHPHIRGAYTYFFWFLPPSGGSSPHTWGILPEAGINVFGLRFIPTYVGHTYTLQQVLGISAVHPHIRGAYCTANPRIGETIWFIPTYVGHTLHSA